MRKLGHDLTIEAWDWRWYAEKVRQQRFQLDEAEVKPYFPLDAMVQAMFDCASRLYGLRFVAQPQVAGYHPDVKVYEVQRPDGSLRGIFVQDNFARPTKRSGAWMNALRWQARNGIDALPIILNNNNFAKGAPGEPTLLSFDSSRLRQLQRSHQQSRKSAPRVRAEVERHSADYGHAAPAIVYAKGLEATSSFLQMQRATRLVVAEISAVLGRTHILRSRESPSPLQWTRHSRRGSFSRSSSASSSSSSSSSSEVGI